MMSASGLVGKVRSALRLWLWCGWNDTTVVERPEPNPPSHECHGQVMGQKVRTRKSKMDAKDRDQKTFFVTSTARDGGEGAF